jgi:rhamnogalacturonan endolyase
MVSSNPFRRLLIAAAAVALTPAISADAAEDVAIQVNGQPAKTGVLNRADVRDLKISNGLLEMTFSTDDIGDLTATSMIKNGKELLHNLNGKEGRDAYRHRSFYIDWGGSAGTMLTQKVDIRRITPDLVEFVLIDDGTRAGATAVTAGGGRGGGGGGGAPAYLCDHHLIMRKGVSGLYGYVDLKCPRGTQANEIRTMYRFDRNIMDWAWNAERTGRQPTYAECDKMQANGDETWILPEGSPYRQFTGSVYQKYDYCAYFSESPMWGHYGHGFGAFYIPVSTEYYGSGPTRQDLIVHQDALILNYIQGGHFGAPTLRMNPGYEKMFGPWLVYIGANDDPKGLIDDALKQVKAEQAAWPYKWVEDPLYQSDRTTVTGTLKISGGRSARNAWIILARPGGNIYGQMGGFMYYVKADADGKFVIPAVRPNTYSLYAWSTEGPITAEFEKDNIAVNGATMDLGAVEWDAPQHAQFLFQIGKPDHLSGEFKLGDSTRSKTRIEEVPAALTYTVGKSKDNQDWYFAQPPGNWDVVFNVERVPPAGGKCYLSLPLAGGTGACAITVNGQPAGRIQKGNDSTIGRDSVRGGTYQLNNLTFDGALLKPGQNMLRLSASGAGLMYDTVVLESD